jgi:histidinol dehydrogenase
MLAVPANIAGCKEVFLCSPQIKGNINPAILYAANLCGVTKILKVGRNTSYCRTLFWYRVDSKVYKIFGRKSVTPNQTISNPIWCAIDMPAGPGIIVVADDSSVPSFVASDLLSQAEHGSG